MRTWPQASVPMVTMLPLFTVATSRPSRTGTPPTTCGIETCHRSGRTCTARTSPSWAGSMPSSARFSLTTARTAEATTAASMAFTSRPSRRPRLSRVTRFPIPLPGMRGCGPMRLVAVPERGSMKTWNLGWPAAFRCRAMNASQASRLGSWGRISSRGTWEVLR